MMICITLAGRRFCIRIPILIVWPPWPPPNGDPWKHLGDWVQLEDPSPQPWKQNLSIVATVHELAKHAQGDLKGRLEQVVKAETAEIQKQLPEGATLHMGGQTGGE